MNFLTLAWFGQNSVAKFLKTLLFTLLYNIPGVIPLAVYSIVKDMETISFQTIVTGNSAGFIFVLVGLSFATGLFGLFRQVIVQYDRDWITLITPKKEIDWRKFLIGAGVWGGIVVISIILDIVRSPQDYIFSFQPIPFFSLLIGVLIIIPIQASSEEILFRGFIMQQIALVGKYVWIPLTLNSVLFALAHSSNPEVDAYGFSLAMSHYTIVALIWGIAAMMDDGLELAMGAHTGNNIIAFLLTTDKNAVIQTPALFTNINPTESWQGVVELVLAGIIFLFILSRIYKWGSWSILWSRIIPPAMPDAEPPSQSDILLEQA